jgi:RHS repeat-associated protein
MNATIIEEKSTFAKTRRISFALILICGLLAGWSAQAQGISTAFYINANSYSAPDNGSGSVTLTVSREAVGGPYNDWNIAASASVLIYLSGSGTYPIIASDVPPAWQGGSYLVTIPANYYSTGVTIPISLNTNVYYDRTGTFTVGNNSGVNPTEGYTSATLTVLDDNSHVGVAAYAGGNYYTGYQILEGGTGGANSVDLRFFRDYGVSARTVSYSLSGSTAIAGTDYTPTLGTVTFAFGSTYVDTTISANNASQIINKLLNVQVTSSSIYKFYPGITNLALTIQQDYPGIGVYSTVSSLTQGQSGGFVFYNTNSWANTPAVTANYTISGTASNGVDYTPRLSGSVVIPAGTYDIETNITATLYTNMVGTKTVTLSVAANAYYTIDTNGPSTTIGILSDVPIISVTTSNQNEYAYQNGPAGAFTITRSGGLDHTVTVNYAITGTAISGVNYTALPASVTFATNQTSTNLNVTVTSSPALTGAATVVLTLATNATFFPGANSQAVVTLLPNSDTTNSVTSPVGRYWRGSGSDPTYWSLVVPVDSETGTPYDNLYGNAYTLYGISAWGSTYYHYNATNSLAQTNNANRIAFNNPIVAFGERVGGTPLYLNQPYNFGVYAGDPGPLSAPIQILVYYRTNYALAGYINLYPPNSSSTSSWNNYTTNGFQVSTSTNYLADGVTGTTNNFGLATILSSSPDLSWGTTSPGAYELTHTANNQATNYYYLVEAFGYLDSQGMSMVQTSGNQTFASELYTLEFEQRPAWRSVFLDQPQFNGSPLPPFYAGKTLAEMLTNTPPVTNAVTISPSAATNLDDSPELRRSPILDNFVASMGNDPMALANYVFNNIDLTDPMDYSDNGNVAEQAINPTGVTRGALGAFVEKQGSPIDQCALLVYLLRQAGVPAVYEFPPRGGLKILDARLSNMLKFQVHGSFSEAGQLYTTNTMITVNYPWVAAYIGTNWVHIFPWLKDHQITEGLNLWDEMPTNYSSAFPWVRDYIYGKTNLLSLAVDNDNTPRVIFPKFLQQTLLQNHPGISVGDIGMDIYNRQHNYSRWQDFPTPTWVTNASTSLESLTSSAITNISPTLTNIFDTVSVEIYSQTDPTKDIQTGDMRLVDLHNREFYIYQTATNSTQVQLSLILVPFRTNITSQLSFTNDSNLTSKEVLSMRLDQYDDQLEVRFKYNRHRALSAAYAVDPNLTFLGLNAGRQLVLERPLRKGDQAAICMSYGRVTRDMLNVHATDIWQMENALHLNPSLTNSVSPDVYEGATMYLAGMSYYEKVGEFDQVNQNLNKITDLSFFAAGLSKIGPARDGSGNLTNNTVYPVLPNVDMFFWEVASVGNGTARPDSGQNDELADQNYNLIAITDGSAEEHQAINTYYQQTNAVSTVRLLQLAQGSGAGIVSLNINNYAAQGTTSYQGKSLQSWDSNLWSQVATAFQGSDGSYVTAYITPGPMTNSAYKGMGALILGWSKWQALISPQSLNGAFGQPFPLLSTMTPNNTINFGLNNNDDYTMTLNPLPSGTALAPTTAPDFEFLNNLNSIQNNSLTVSYYDSTWNSSVNTVYNLPGTGTANQNLASAVQTTSQQGYLGEVGGMVSQALTAVADPVHPITGEFYIDETDLQLPGPIPLALRRNYSSQNLADNQFGAGWKFSIMPYLSVTTGSTNIYAADMDGAVLAYVQTTTNANVWLPTLAANPQLNNNTTAGAGGLVNRLRDRIVLTGTTNYTLYAADGSVRTFQTMTFNNGILNQTRPYLQKWTDSRGNYYTFAFGTDSTQPSFGEVTRIQCSNGNYLGFDYDIYGHVIDAYSGDGRRLTYDYDQYGDLITVTLPDATTRSYVYQHASQAVTNGSAFYSTHLIVEEDKPDGRELLNAYDSNRRVTNQLSTAGADLTPIRTATFIYANNFNITNSYTNAISGYTFIIDGNNHTNRYDYTNSLVTQVTDPLGQTVQQTWYADNATAPGYPRSVAARKDKRGMLMQFQYDGNGNITNTITTGDITGDGITTQTATNTALYNSNNLPAQVIDAAGNGMVYVYDPTFTFLPQQTIRIAGGIYVSTNFMFYGDATNVVVNGNTTQTNIAFGVLTRQVRAYGSPDAATNDMVYDGHGFPTQSIRYTGTADPAIVNNYFYNERGNRVVAADALGAYTFSDFDAMNRPTEQENFDEFGNPLSWSFNYYNDNGEISWIDGPRYNPEDYIFYDYDGAGRPTTEIHWRSEAKSDGSGVEAPSGYNLYAQTFYQYDPLGNLTLKVDPRGAMTTNIYDALCRPVQSKHLDVDGVTVLSSEGYAYEPGGQVRFYTNALGGVTETEYTIAGKPEYRHNADGSTNGLRYYLDGRVKREIQSNGAYWQTTYNDVNLITTRIFYSASGTSLATNSFQLDRRGNIIQKVDAGNNVFTTTFDGLDRPKVTAGPAIVTVNSFVLVPGGPTIYTTNVLQQVSANLYDAVGRAVTNINALGEMTVTKSDAIGRPVSTQIYSASGALVRESYASYSPDHNSVTTTSGSGASAIINTVYTDNDGHNVLTIAYPAGGYLDYTWRDFDLSGNLDYEEHDSSPGGAWTFASYTHDGLNRTISKTDRDYALTTYAFDGLGDLTNRTIPGGLQWQASYTNSGQILQEQISGGGQSTRTDTYTYYPSGNAFAGLLDTKTDGRGLVSTYSYDDWLRQASVVRTDFNYDYVDTFFYYDPRGYATNITEENVDNDTGNNPKVILRSYDPYGQLSSETITVNGNTFSTSGQTWDAAGRRTGLSINGANYNFASRADGALTYASDPTGSGNYSFDTAGLLTNRTVGVRSTTVTLRDGEGRPYTIVTTVNGATQLTESLTRYLDGTLADDTLYRADFTDSRSYSYAGLSRRLVQEQLNLNGSTQWTNTLAYDSGVSAESGVLTKMGANGAALWSGGVSPFTRVNTETNTSIMYPANGRFNGQAALTASLDGQPLSVTTNSSGDPSYPYQWRTVMELTPGVHQLKVAAAHPSGFFTAWATNTFTNNFAQETASVLRDGGGNVEERIWRNPDGSTNRLQQFYWDAKDRLTDYSDFQHGTQNGIHWHAEYDGLNRRLFTTCTVITNGQDPNLSPLTINQYYDPQVEFLELGVSYGNTTEWKLYGPDLNGVYGGLNGTGGLDGVSPYLNLFNPVISDYRGNILAEVTNGAAVVWNPARPTGYGAVSGYRPVALAYGAGVAQSSAWRGRWVDITGYYNIGRRLYDPVSGMWLSYDPAWNEKDPNYLTFCGGDPINGFDSDGRVTRGGYQGTLGLAEGAGSLLWDVGGTIGYGVTSVFSQDAANDIYGSQFQGLQNVGTGVGNLVWDAGGSIGYGVTSIFSQDAANDIYGSQMQGLENIGISMSGGANQSAAYRVGYVAPAVASFFFGGEAADAGEAGDVGNGVRAAEAGSQATEETAVAADQSGQIIQNAPQTTVDAQQVMRDGNAAIPENSGQAAPVASAPAAGADTSPFLTVTPPQGTFGSGNFGNAIHQSIVDELQAQFPDVNFRFSVKPGQTGVDVEVLNSQDVDTVGFQYGEIKPNTQSGQNTFNRQVQNWQNNGTIPPGSSVQPITYDANGNVNLGFTFKKQ